MKLHVVTFGCQMSAAEGEELAAPLIGRGYTAVAEPDAADAIVLNTCTVRQHAEDKALSLIGRLRAWKDERPERLLIVAGCAAERLGPWIKTRFPHVDLVVGAKSIEDYPKVFEEALGARFDALAETKENFGTEPDKPTGWQSKHSAFVTIMRGCNYTCSYCIVPAVRGRELYRPFDTIMAEARAKTALGAREITLLGQTVNSWRDDTNGFAELLTKISEIDGLERIRFESPHPRYVTNEMVSVMSTNPKVCNQLHMPLQSGSDDILKKMRRNYTATAFIEKTERLKTRVSGIELSTDIIVGFPSETDEDFERTLEAVKAFEPSWSYTFKYSPRDGTESASMPDDVPAALKEERLARLNLVCDELTEKALNARIGKTLQVLDETGGFGRTRDGFRVSWKDAGTAGKLVDVRIAGASTRVLKGEI